MTDPLTRVPVSDPPCTTATCRRPYCVLPMSATRSSFISASNTSVPPSGLGIPSGRPQDQDSCGTIRSAPGEFPCPATPMAMLIAERSTPTSPAVARACVMSFWLVEADLQVGPLASVYGEAQSSRETFLAWL